MALEKSKYRDLRFNPPTLEVTKNAQDIIIKMVSCMCDNRHTFRLKKNERGEFKLSTGGHAFSNFQIKYLKAEIEWEADANRWECALDMINSGTAVIEEIQSRDFKGDETKERTHARTTENFMYWTQNFSSNWIEKVWGTGHPAKHLNGKWHGCYERHGASLAPIKFFFELDTANRAKLLNWVEENYNAFGSN